MLNPADPEIVDSFSHLGRFSDEKLGKRPLREVILLSPRWEYAQQALMKGRSYPDIPQMREQMERVRVLWGLIPRLELLGKSLSEQSKKDNN